MYTDDSVGATAGTVPLLVAARIRGHGPWPWPGPITNLDPRMSSLSWSPPGPSLHHPLRPAWCAEAAAEPAPLDAAPVAVLVAQHAVPRSLPSWNSQHPRRRGRGGVLFLHLRYSISTLCRPRDPCHRPPAQHCPGPNHSGRQLQQPPAQQCFSLIPFQLQLPATSRSTVFFSHITPATGSSSSPANIVQC